MGKSVAGRIKELPFDQADLRRQIFVWQSFTNNLRFEIFKLRWFKEVNWLKIIRLNLENLSYASHPSQIDFLSKIISVKTSRNSWKYFSS